MYTIEVVRKREALGEGVLSVYQEGERIAYFPLITGSNQIDPGEYGGLTPPIIWTITEPIEHRKHPAINRGDQTMARIYPLNQDDVSLYARRTFDLEGDRAYPFMIHAGSRRAGVSTGCLAIVECWSEAIDVINRAWHYNQSMNEPLLVEVLNQEDAEY